MWVQQGHHTNSIYVETLELLLILVLPECQFFPKKHKVRNKFSIDKGLNPPYCIEIELCDKHFGSRH